MYMSSASTGHYFLVTILELKNPDTNLSKCVCTSRYCAPMKNILKLKPLI